jgi:hypothetical protein
LPCRTRSGVTRNIRDDQNPQTLKETHHGEEEEIKTGDEEIDVEDKGGIEEKAVAEEKSGTEEKEGGEAEGYSEDGDCRSRRASALQMREDFSAGSVPEVQSQPGDRPVQPAPWGNQGGLFGMRILLRGDRRLSNARHANCG